MTPRSRVLTGARAITASKAMNYRTLAAWWLKQPRHSSSLLRACGGRCLLEAVRPAELLAEAFRAACGIDKRLLSGDERMAVAADIDVDLRQRAAGLEGVSTRAVDGAKLIFRMGFGFHDGCS